MSRLYMLLALILLGASANAVDEQKYAIETTPALSYINDSQVNAKFTPNNGETEQSNDNNGNSYIKDKNDMEIVIEEIIAREPPKNNFVPELQPAFYDVPEGPMEEIPLKSDFIPATESLYLGETPLDLAEDNPLKTFVQEPQTAIYLDNGVDHNPLQSEFVRDSYYGVDNFNRKPLIDYQDEIMDHAESGIIGGYSILKRSRQKQKARRRFANRRYFRKNPVRRRPTPFFYYPYYAYNNYYRPGSLIY